VTKHEAAQTGCGTRPRPARMAYEKIIVSFEYFCDMRAFGPKQPILFAVAQPSFARHQERVKLTTSEQPFPKVNRLARANNAIARYRGAVELGWYDFIMRFRRSFLGPLWAPIQLALWIGALALILHEALGDDFGSYVIYVGLGIYAWDFISASLQEGPTHFTSQDQLIKNIPVDISYITIRKISFLVFRSVFQLPVPILLVLFFGKGVNLDVLLLLPVAVLFICYTYACLIVFGVIGTYFRDFTFLMQSLMRFLFFTTPIIWRGDVGFRKVVSQYNPYSYFLELVRAPIEGVAASPLAWIVVSALSLGGLCFAFWIQATFRKRLIYWL